MTKTSKARRAIKTHRQENYPEWYLQVVQAADLAENSPVRGSMIIRPWGYAIWERIQKELDQKIKETGHENVYFPLLIPLSFLEKEAEHVAGFAKECAVITHSKLKLKSDNSGLEVASPLEEPYVIRPTSETIIAHSFAKWIQSHRDLPILINQWANIMRWEMRTRPFLRTTEILWQEGHTAHSTIEEANEETIKMLSVYKDFMEDFLDIPVVYGKKTPDERFPGAIATYSIEAMMQDGKALQAGTSHFLGQNFSKASNITFTDKNGELQHPWTTSWGMSTRIIGATVMTHGDDNGLVLPPRLAPQQIIIIPVGKPEQHPLEYCEKIKKEISALSCFGEKIRVKIDTKPRKGSEKNWEYIKKGVPIRLEIGEQELKNNKVTYSQRLPNPQDKIQCSREEFLAKIPQILSNYKIDLKNISTNRLKNRIKPLYDVKDLENHYPNNLQYDRCTMLLCNWHDSAYEHQLVKQFKLTPRCIPISNEYLPTLKQEPCVFTEKKEARQVLLAKAY